MKKKDLINLKSKTEKELTRLSEKKVVELEKVRANMKVGQEKNLKKVKLLRHEISQILTVLREKEIVKRLEEEVKKADDNAKK